MAGCGVDMGGDDIGLTGAYYRISTCEASDKYVDPDTWLASASQKQGSWWPEWVRWLDAHSSSARGHMSFRPELPGRQSAGNVQIQNGLTSSSFLNALVASFNPFDLLLS